jgi:hypothetical protein
MKFRNFDSKFSKTDLDNLLSILQITFLCNVQNKKLASRNDELKIELSDFLKTVC